VCWERRLETESGVGELEKCHVLLDNKRRVPEQTVTISTAGRMIGMCIYFRPVVTAPTPAVRSLAQGVDIARVADQMEFPR
jgi:hypothetical protein